MIGAERGYVLEIDEKNPLVNDEIAQSMLLKMQGFTFIPYTYQTTESDFAIDVGDMFDIANTNNVKYQTFVMGNSWEFAGAISQTWQAKGENELNNSYASKGPISKQLESIVKEQIPNAKQEAIDRATELLTEFNGGYVVKKEGELFISDNEDIDKAQHLWRWNINGLGYSSHGIYGPYGLAITMDGKIVADFITTGTMSAERINGGTLKLGGNNNTNGSIQVVDASGKSLVNISKDGLVLNNGTKLIGNGGVLSNLQFIANGFSEVYGDIKSAGEYFMLGFVPDDITAQDKYNLFIDVAIPDNFTIMSAYITLRHIPDKVTMIDNSIVYGYARNVKCYIADLNGNAYVEGYQQSEYSIQLSGLSYNEIANCFNNSSNSFTPSVPNSNNLKVTQITSKDIGSSIGKKSRIKIATSNPNPNTIKNCFAETGWIYAALNIYGYLQ